MSSFVNFLVILVVSGWTVGATADSDVAIEVISEVSDCSRRAKANDFVTLHFVSKWEDGEIITST